MFIGYYKSRVKEEVVQIMKKFIYRRNNIIQKDAYIGYNVSLVGGVYVGRRATLEANVSLAKNVRIGNNTLLSNISVGENSHIESNVICTGFGKGKIVIGRESYVGIGCILDWSDNITIGNFVHSCAHLFTHSSAKQALSGDALNDKTKRFKAPIVIEDNVYIGYGCIVYPGVTIHRYSVVLPNSVVNKDVPSYTMVGGAPFKVIKNIDDNWHNI